ncbi:MAG: transcriptional regulator, partial [Candidatus Poribacteria bacterium]|nr:transcriptional regulator [Candidatus Poribacteria bacterium]
GEKRRIGGVAHRMMSHIIDNGYYLIDMDGERTRWGVWDPALLNGEWKPQQGLNSLEILAYLKTAHHITGERRFESEYRRLIEEHHYAMNTIDQKLLDPGWVNHSDDELAFCAYYPLLRYERDPGLRAIYLQSLERSWQIERPERCPLWNIMYGALTGRACDIELAVQSLQELPIDLVSWEMKNSHRADVRAREPEGGWTQELDAEILPYFERPVHKWNGNPYRLDGGDAGHREEDGTVFLLPYWMGRYHGLIAR